MKTKMIKFNVLLGIIAFASSVVLILTFGALTVFAESTPISGSDCVYWVNDISNAGGVHAGSSGGIQKPSNFGTVASDISQENLTNLKRFLGQILQLIAV